MSLRVIACFVCSVLTACLSSFLVFNDFIIQSLLSSAAEQNIFLWGTYLNPIYNSYFVWRADPLFQTLLEFAQTQELSSKLYFIIQNILFSSGLCLLLTLIEIRTWPAVLLAVLTTASFCIMFGADLAIFQAISWIPWALTLFVALQFSLLRTSMALLFSLFLGLRLMHGYQYALPALLGSLLLATAMNKLWQERIPFSAILCGLILSLPTLFGMGQIPFPDMIDYPSYAFLSPDDGLPGNILPLVTAAPSIPFLNHSYLNSFLAFYSFIFLCIALVNGKFLLQEINRKLFLIIALCTLCGLSAGLLPANLAAISPIAVLERILPHMLFVPIAPLWIFFGYLCLLLGVWASLSYSIRARASILFFSFSCLVLASTFHKSQRSAEYSFFPAETVNQLSAEQRRHLVSPSYYVIRTYGPLSLQPRDRKYLAAARFIDRIRASHSSESTRLMLDKNSKTRWSPGKGRQTGDEWIELFFNKTLKLSAVLLDTGEFKADFPAAIRVLISDSCSKQSNIDWQLIQTLNPWPGLLSYTANGYPFFDDQSYVAIPFEGADASCMRIEQTGARPFDWSIAKIKLELEEETTR